MLDSDRLLLAVAGLSRSAVFSTINIESPNSCLDTSVPYSPFNTVVDFLTDINYQTDFDFYQCTHAHACTHTHTHTHITSTNWYYWRQSLCITTAIAGSSVTPPNGQLQAMAMEHCSPTGGSVGEQHFNSKTLLLPHDYTHTHAHTRLTSPMSS